MLMKQKKYLKLSKIWRVVKLTTLNWYTGQVINEYFDFTRFGALSSAYLKLVNGNVGINVVKLKLKEFKNEIDSLERKKAKKQSNKINKKDPLGNAETLYNGLNIIANAFENRIFESKQHPEINVDIDPTPDSNTYESHGLTKKELETFRKLFSYKNPEELRQTLVETTDEKYNELLKDLNITITVLKNYFNTKTSVSRTRKKHLVNVVEDILDRVRWRGNIPDLESEEPAAQRRNQSGRRLKILTSNQMLSRLPISLAQLKPGNNSDKLKNGIRQLSYSLYK